MKILELVNSSLLKTFSISLLSIFFYVVCISIFTFFHFHLSHDMFTINSWISESKWEILFLIKGFVWFSVIYWKSMTQPARGVLRQFRTLWKGSIDSLFASLLNIFAIVFFVYYEGANVFDFDFFVFVLVSIYFILDVIVFFLFEVEINDKLKLASIVGALSLLNGIYLHVIEMFEPGFIVCYIFAFAAGLSVVFTKRVNKSMIFSIGVFGVALFIGLTNSNENSRGFLIELTSSKLNTLILFLSLAVANYFFVVLKTARLRKLNEVKP